MGKRKRSAGAGVAGSGAGGGEQKKRMKGAARKKKTEKKKKKKENKKTFVGGGVPSMSAEDAATWRNIIKFGLMTISACHISELYTTSNFICGTFGSACAAIDVYNLWPRKQDE